MRAKKSSVTAAVTIFLITKIVLVCLTLVAVTHYCCESLAGGSNLRQLFLLARSRLPVPRDAAIRHLNDPVTAFGNRRVVRNDEQRLAAFLAEPHEDVHDIRFVRRVQ